MNSCKRLARRLLIAKMPSLHTFVRLFVRLISEEVYIVHLPGALSFRSTYDQTVRIFVHTYGTCYNDLIVNYIYRNVKGEVPPNTLKNSR